MMLLKDEEICALSGLEVGEEYPPTLDHHRDIAKAAVKKVVEELGRIDVRTADHAQYYNAVRDFEQALKKEIE